MAGFIVIDRKIKEWKWYHNNTALGLWSYILLEANWADCYIHDGSCIERGSFATSLPKMALETGLSESTVRRWLKRFEDDGQIEQKVTNKYRVIKVLNYSTYQDFDYGTADSQTDSQVTGQTAGQAKVKRKSDDTQNNQNNKNNNNNQKTIISRTRMPRPSIEEVQEYITLNNYAVNAERFIDYYESNGWKVGRNPMKNWKACVRTWHKKEEERRAQQRSQKGVLPF